MRQIVLDTETTGLSPKDGHRIIEIGCVELLDRRLTGNNFHMYINPDREIDAGAINVHGITNEFLEDKPRFHEIADELMDYLTGAELIIHNAPFDVGFLNHELGHINNGKWQILSHYCTIFDTLEFARKKHPGQRNSLDALCKRYDVNNTHRTLHGALLDAQILSQVYLLMTGEQKSLRFDESPVNDKYETLKNQGSQSKKMFSGKIKCVKANQEELSAHEKYVQALEKSSGNSALWKN